VAIISISCSPFIVGKGNDPATEHAPMKDRVMHPPTSAADDVAAVRDEIDALLE
jgi:hypothetical protein